MGRTTEDVREMAVAWAWKDTKEVWAVRAAARRNLAKATTTLPRLLARSRHYLTTAAAVRCGTCRSERRPLAALDVWPAANEMALAPQLARKILRGDLMILHPDDLDRCSSPCYMICLTVRIRAEEIVVCANLSISRLQLLGGPRIE